MEVIYKNVSFSFLFNRGFEAIVNLDPICFKQHSVALSVINHSFTDLEKDISMMQMREVIFQSTINIPSELFNCMSLNTLFILLNAEPRALKHSTSINFSTLSHQVLTSEYVVCMSTRRSQGKNSQINQHRVFGSNEIPRSKKASSFYYLP